MPFKGVLGDRVLKRHPEKAWEHLRKRPSEKVSGINHPGVEKKCEPSDELTIECDKDWHELTFGHFYIREEGKQKDRPPGAPRVFVVKNDADRSEFREWSKEGTAEAHKWNQFKAVQAIEFGDQDLWYRMHAWAGRPARVFGPNRQKARRVGRVWTEVTVGATRESPDGNIHPAEKENSRGEWFKKMAELLRMDGVPEAQIRGQLDEAAGLWGPDVPHVKCADESCYLEQRKEDDLPEGQEPVLVTGWDVSANAVVPFLGGQGGAYAAWDTGLAEIAVCIRAQFRCLPPRDPPPEYSHSSPMYFATRQDEFESYERFVEWWRETHFPYEMPNVRRQRADGAISSWELADEFDAMGPKCDCVGCKCGSEKNQRMGRHPSSGTDEVAWREAVGRAETDVFWRAAIHYHAKAGAPSPTSSSRELHVSDRTPSLSRSTSGRRVPQARTDRSRAR